MIYDLIGSLAGDDDFFLTFTLTPVRQELSSKIWIVTRPKGLSKTHPQGWLLTKFSWIQEDLEDLIWPYGQINFKKIAKNFEGTLYAEEANELFKFCRIPLNYNLRPEGRPKYTGW